MRENNQHTGKTLSVHRLKAIIKHLFFHNGWLKVLAILISVLLWAGLISQDKTLTREKVFTNVNVTISGLETLKRSGYIVVSDLGEALSGVSMTAAVPQQQYENAEASTYNLRVDLSRINSTGMQELKLLSTNSATYGKIVDTSPASVFVEVEEYVVRQRIPVSVSIVGDVPDGWYVSTPTVDPALITVSGPKSVVQNISRARVFVHTDSVEWEESTPIDSAPFTLYNRSGDEVDPALLDITSNDTAIDSVVIEMTIWPTRTFRTTDLVQVSGKVARGYEIKGIDVSPKTITVAARSDVLDQMNDLLMEKSINVTNLKETTVFQLKVQKPSDDAVLFNETVTVTVDIGPTDT